MHSQAVSIRLQTSNRDIITVRRLQAKAIGNCRSGIPDNWGSLNSRSGIPGNFKSFWFVKKFAHNFDKIQQNLPHLLL